MKRFLTAYFFILLAYIGTAQNVATVAGVIYDSDNSLVSNCFVKVRGTNKTTYSNENGRYSINIAANNSVVLEVVYSGEFLQKSIPATPAGKTVYRNFKFSRSFALGEVVFGIDKTRDRPIIKIDPKGIEKFAIPGGTEQLLKGIGLGVSNSGGELSSGYNVRGGNFDENLVYVNGIEVYRPFLVRSGQQEGLSVINPDLIESLEFSAGGFQAKYGDKLSSVLDIKYRDPKSFKSTIHLGLLGANLHVEDRLASGRFSYLIGARYKSNQYLLGTLDVQGDYKPRFYDVQTLLKYRIRSNLSVSYLTTISQNRYQVTPQSRQTSFGNVNSALSLYVAFGGKEVMEYTTWMNGLSLDYKPQKNVELKLITSSYTSNEREHFTVEGAYRLSELETNQGSDNFANEKALLGTGYFIDHARNNLQAQVYSVAHNGKYFSKKSTLQWGVGYTNETIVDKLKEWRYNDSSEYNITTRAKPIDSNEIVLDEYLKADIEIQSFRLKAYVQNSQTILPRYNLKATYGIRTNYWSFNNENVISPRLQFSWEPNKFFNQKLEDAKDTVQKTRRDWLLRFASGYYYQPPFYRELRGVDGVLNPNLKAQRSAHFVFGGDLNFKAWQRPFKFITEVYYKHLDRMVPYVIDNVRIRYLAENSSQGYAAGIDARVNGEFIEGIESWFNMSVLQTQERLYYTNENGEEQLSDWLRRPTDQRVNFSILFQDELPRNPSYKMNLALSYGSRIPFFYNAEDRTKPGFTIPPYRRVDIGFSKILVDASSERRPKWMRNAESLWASIEVFNLLQVNNTISYILVKDFSNNVYGVPNYLTGRRVNLRLILKI